MKYAFYLSIILLISSCNQRAQEDDFEDLEDLYSEDFLDEIAVLDEDYEVEIIENGLECDYIYLSVNDVMIDGHITYGDVIFMHFDLIEGITLSEDYSEYNLGSSYLFTTLKGDTVEYWSYEDMDLFTEYHNEYDDIYLNNSIEVSEPLEEGESYYFYSSFRDEATGKELMGKALITIDENPHINAKNDGLKCSVAYVWDKEEETYVTNNEIEVGKYYYMGVHGLRGFKSQGEMAHYGASLFIEDENGNVLVEAEDYMISESPKLKSEIFKEVNLEFILYEYYDMDVVHVTANFWDKRGGGSFSFQCDFDVIEEQYDFDYYDY